MSTRGIDVSYAQGRIDWKRVRTAGIDFAIIKSSQGKLIREPDGKPFTDPQFRRNIEGAAAAGVKIGVYHYLCARNLREALAEADYMIEICRPYRDIITIGAVCDAEEDRFLPRDRQTLTGIVHGFCKKIKLHGKMRPILYANPNYLTYRLGNLSIYPLWLAYWGVPEARALRYKPVMWQYGAGDRGSVDGIDARVDLNIGYALP